VTPEEIKELRKELACSASELAKALDIDARTVVLWESGEMFPTKKHVDLMQKLRAAGPSAIAKKPKGKAAQITGMERLHDPKLWEILRKLMEHPAFFAQVEKIAEEYPDTK
jgi:transcriptional regulator with XRE-family HTH domain